MSELQGENLSQYVYRRVHPGQWSKKKNRASERLFVEEEGNELSVFRADLITPRGVLQHGIDDAKVKSVSLAEEERAIGQRLLDSYGQTVDEWLQSGWRVVRLPFSAFESRNYWFDGPEPDGHMNAYGDHKLYAFELRDIAREVPEAELDASQAGSCLTEPEPSRP